MTASRASSPDICPGQITWDYDRAEMIADGAVHPTGVGLGCSAYSDYRFQPKTANDEQCRRCEDMLLGENRAERRARKIMCVPVGCPADRSRALDPTCWGKSAHLGAGIRHAQLTLKRLGLKKVLAQTFGGSRRATTAIVHRALMPYGEFCV